MPKNIRIRKVPTEEETRHGSEVIQTDPDSVFGSESKKAKQALIRIHCIHMFLGLPDPDPLVRGMDPDPFIIKQDS
jgi:hypothetical protein